MWLTAKEIKDIYKITGQTLYNWRKSGKIEYKMINERKFSYKIKDYKNERKNVIYSRVSNTKQKHDLENQIKLISQYMISNGILVDEVYSDIASGMNENRIGFDNLINDVISYKIDKIYISYKDRLTRFGYQYFEKLFKKYNTEIVVLNSTKEEDFQDELTSDLISIIHHFSMKMYSNRRKLLKELKIILNLTMNLISTRSRNNKNK